MWYVSCMSSYSEFIISFGKKFKSFSELKNIDITKKPKDIFLVHNYIDSKGNERVFYTIEENLTDLKTEIIKRDYYWSQYSFDSLIYYFVILDKKDINRFIENSKIKKGKPL